MNKVSRLFVGVLCLSFLVGGMAAAEQSFWADTANPWRYLPVARGSDLAQMAKNGYLLEYDVNGINGDTQTRFLSSGAQVNLVNGNEATTSMIDESTGELKTVSITKFICGWKYYTQTTLYDQDGKVILGTRIDVYDYNTKKYSLTLGGNVPDMARISEAIENLIEKLGTDLKLVAGTTDYQIKYKTGVDASGNDIYVSQTITVSEADVRTQVLGVLSTNYLCGLLADKDAKTLAGIAAKMGDLEALKEALVAAGIILQADADKFLKNNDDIETFLGGESITVGTDTFVGLAEFGTAKLQLIINQLMNIGDGDTVAGLIMKDGRIRAALRSLADDGLDKKNADGAKEITTATLLDNIGYYDGTSSAMLNDKHKLISDILVSVDVIDMDPITKKETKRTAVSVLIDILNSKENTNINKPTYADELEKAGVLSGGLNRSGIPQLTPVQVEDIIAAIGQGGCPLVYLDQNGNILKKTSDLYSLKDQAYATVMLSNITFSADDLLAGADHCMAIWDYWYGKYETLVDQNELEDNPLKVAMLCTTVVNGKEYVVTKLPEDGLAGVTENWKFKVQRYEQVTNADKQVEILNHELTAKDYRGSAQAYVQVLINMAMEQGLMVGQKEAITVTITQSDAYANGKLGKVVTQQTYSDADVDRVMAGFLAAGTATMSQSVVDNFNGMSTEDKKEFVAFVIEAANAGLKTESADFTFNGQTVKFCTNPATDGISVTFGTEDTEKDTQVEVKVRWDGALHFYTKAEGDSGYTSARHFVASGLVDVITRGNGKDYYNLETFQPIIGAFAISNITIHTYKSSSSIGGVDATELLPTSNVPLGIDADNIAGRFWGDPAVTGRVIGAYDVNPYDTKGNLIPNLASHLIANVDNPEALSAYTGNTVYLLVNVGYYTDDAGVVHVQQSVWDNTSKDVQEQVIERATGVVSDFDTMIVSIEVNLQNLEGVNQGAANSREENVAAIQNTLVPATEIILWGIMNDSATEMNAYGLGAGPFKPYHPLVDLLNLGFGPSEQMPLDLL